MKGLADTTTDMEAYREKVGIMLALASTRSDAQDRLAALHQFELTLSDTYDWPWLFWPAFFKDALDVASSLAAFFKDAPLSSLTAFEQDIFAHAVCLRQPKADLHAIAEFLGDPSAILKQIPALQPEFLFELAQMAFVDKRWRIVMAAAGRLLRERPWGKDGVFAERMADLLFEMLFFAIYRPGMPTYVRDPKVLNDQLDQLAGRPFVQDVLARDSITSRVFRANRLAMTGRLEEALPLYDEANEMDGFSSPVIRQHQTIYETRDVFSCDGKDLDAWYADRSMINHVFRHAGGGHVFLVGCNQHYFDLYAELYLECVAILNRGALVHIHIVNLETDEDALIRQLDAWEARYDVKVNYSLERNRISLEQPDYIPAISASARYIELGDFLEAYDTITLTDIDGWVQAPLADMAVESGDIRIASWIWRKSQGYWRLPWSNIAACHLSVRSTPASRELARLVRRYMLHVIKRNTEAKREVFYLDQVVLFFALQHMVVRGEIEIGFLRGGFEQSEEQRFGMRHEGKRQDLIKKIRAMQQDVEAGPGTAREAD